jgi:hypothetical protein
MMTMTKPMSAMIPFVWWALFFVCCRGDTTTLAMTTTGKDGADDPPKSASWQNHHQSPPNIVILFADNLGYNDIGWFQQQEQQKQQQSGTTSSASSSNSPNIDRLAQQGKTFYNWNSAAHLCSASRAALLTGKYPVRTGVYPGVFHNDAQYGLLPEEVTLAEALQEAANYSTSIVGKWHLGHRAPFLPTHQGFDHWLGIPYHMSGGSIDNHTCHNSMGAAALNVSAVWLPLYQDATIVQQPVQVQDIATHYAATATQFIRDQSSTSSASQDEEDEATTTKTKKNPFFLYLAFSHVHQLCAPRDFVEPQTCQWSKKEGTSGRFETAVQEMDWVAGQVLQALEETGTVNNTIVIFTSDNGPWVAEQTCSGSKGPFHGQWYVVVTQCLGMQIVKGIPHLSCWWNYFHVMPAFACLALTISACVNPANVIYSTILSMHPSIHSSLLIATVGSKTMPTSPVPRVHMIIFPLPQQVVLIDVFFPIVHGNWMVSLVGRIRDWVPCGKPIFACQPLFDIHPALRREVLPMHSYLPWMSCLLSWP